MDVNNLVYVTEWGTHHVSVFTHEGQFVRNFGDDPWPLKNPREMTFDSEGDLYICDSPNNRIVVY